jgi:ribonucleoside-diphosphate reductase alpha chain
VTATPRRTLSQNPQNQLTGLGEKIYLDRYALKDVTRETLAVGDTVIVLVDPKTNQREIGTVISYPSHESVVVELRDETRMAVPIEQVDKPLEVDPAQMMDRVARGIASVEKTEEERALWQKKFREAMDGWKFVPAGRILTAAGSDQQLTFFNCYVIPSPQDSRAGIFKTLSQMTEIMSRGGGVGINLSSLRPQHSYVKGVNGRSSGAVSWGAVYSFVTGLIEQGGSRRGALMLILDDWHPDIMSFISSKREMGRITNANISVSISDALMEAVKQDADWELIFPDTTDPEYNDLWDGDLVAWRDRGKAIISYKTIKARELWQSIVESAWASAEPGLFFVDRYNAMSNSWYFGHIRCTNPCGEQGLPSWGVCNLGAINLAKFYTENDVDWEGLGDTIHTAVRFLDNVIDATPYFFDENRTQQQAERRVGLNTMGLAELLIKMGIRYGSQESVDFIDKLYEFIATTSYEASIALAEERGSFPLLESDKFLQSGYMKTMPEKIRTAVAEKGVRNVTLLTQAPNGTIGTMVGTSTGIEPFYSWTYFRKTRLGLHEQNVAIVQDWKDEHPGEELPDFFITAMDLSPDEHVRIEAAIQRWVDSSISKTCNVPNNYTVEQVGALYEEMYHLGCKGGTVYRDGSRDEQVLMLKVKDSKQEGEEATQPLEQPLKEGEKVYHFTHAVDPLPARRQGMTVSTHTPLGTVHVTSNRDENGEPFEVFITIGKAGSDLQADAEAMGRLISLQLRIASPLSRLERLQLIISQLEGIGGSRSVGLGPNRVHSLADAVAKVLRQAYLSEEQSGYNSTEYNQLPAPREDDGTVDFNTRMAGADLCPNCGMGTFIREEGCRKCFSCGYSEC